MVSKGQRNGAALWYDLLTKRDVALKSLDRLWKDCRTEKRMRTCRLVCSRVSNYIRREEEYF